MAEFEGLDVSSMQGAIHVILIMAAAAIGAALVARYFPAFPFVSSAGTVRL